MIVEITYDTNNYTAEFSVTDFTVEISYAAASGGSAAWGDITGTLSNQTDLQAALDAKQSTGNYLTTQYVFSNGNGVTFGTNGQTVTASVNTNYQSTGNYLTTQSAFVFSNGNGVSFGTNGSTVTATVQTNYLTTAMASNAGSNFVAASAVFNGTNISGTIASNAISLSVNPGGGGGGAAISAGANSQSTGTVIFSNANGVSFGLNAGTLTATVATNYLTTARASTDAVGLNTALTANGVSWTVNSSGLSLNVPAFLTTAAQSNHSHNFATTTTNGATIIVGTTNSAGVTIGVPAFLTTARASNDAIGLNTAQSNVTWTVNSSGISFDARGYAGTATGATNANVTVNSGGVSVSVASQSNQSLGIYGSSQTVGQSSSSTVDARSITFVGQGIASVGLSGGSVLISVPSGGGAGDGYNIIAAGGSTANTTGTIVFSNSNGVSFGLNGATITANAYNGTLSQFEPYPLVTGSAVSSHAAGSMVLVPFILNDDLAVSRVNLIRSFNVNTTSSSNSSYSGSYVQSQSFTLWTRGTGTNSSTLGTAYTTSVSFGVSSSLTSNSISMGVSYLSQANSTSWATSSWSSTSAGLNLTGFWTGLKPVPIPMLTTLTLGEYWVGLQASSAITTAGSSIVPFVVSNLYMTNQITTIGDWGRTSGSVSQSMIFNQGLGLVSNTTATSLALSNVSASVPHRVYFNFSNYPLI